jgi:sporulation protein YlmC with PRC-barrel domain
MKASALAAGVAFLMSSAALAQNNISTPPAATPPVVSSPTTREPAPDALVKSEAPTQEVTGVWNTKDFMGSRVYNMAGERIGDVNDVLIDDGRVTAIVIGVGGFLGIGEKEVSMQPDQVKRMGHSDGEAYFTVNSTKDQLQAAPAYVGPAKQVRTK